MRKSISQLWCKLRTGHREIYTEVCDYGSYIICFSCGKVF